LKGSTPTVSGQRRKKNIQNLQELCYRRVAKNLAAQGDFEHGPPYHTLFPNAIIHSQPHIFQKLELFLVK
jgi:hypothetical protein